MGDLSNEPSMEDILASIKKIISEDSDGKMSPSLKRDVVTFERDEERVEEEALAEVATASVAEEDILNLNAGDEAAAVLEPLVPPSAIVSPDAAAASRSALASLSHMLVKPEVGGSDTLEGLVREMLKPMMKQWLDDHLPEVVERIVAQEVGRISGRVL
jgi:uncharacterized protein